ncbi:hypothetical protein [Corynebacterium kalidii]
MTEIQDDQLSPAGEGHAWLPTAPTATHGTRDLIDTELVEVIRGAEKARRDLTE